MKLRMRGRERAVMSLVAVGAVLQDAVIGAIAQRRGKSAAQVALRWALQQGVSVIPSSSKQSRIEANFDVSSWRLDEDEILSIQDRECGQHFYWHAAGIR